MALYGLISYDSIVCSDSSDSFETEAEQLINDRFISQGCDVT